MTEGSTKGFLLSATLHGTVAALLFIFGYVLKRDVAELPKVFELVAGEGDNFAAKEAPALGKPGGVKLDLPATPEAKPTPPAPPVTPQSKPVTPPAPKQADPTMPDFKKKIVREVIRAESKAKQEIKKERAAEKKKLEEEQKRMTKEEFDRANKAKASPPPTKVASVKSPKVDAEGIAKGVVGGSTKNKTGGAGGKAMTSDNDDVLAAYDALFKQRLRAEFEPPPGLSDTLRVTLEFRSQIDGSLTNVRVVKPSGSPEFDRAVLEAIRRVRMPARPDRKSETVTFAFSMTERNEG